jgi:hypothetical protein
MIDKAREADYVRGDNEDAWDENDWKTERALQNDRTREGVNNILNHYLDRHHGIVKNPYRHPADLEYIDGPHADYKGIVQKSLPWNTTADKVNELADETMFPDYKSPANRQKLFDQYYPYLDLAPSAKPSKKGTIAKAAAFGAMMGKMAGNPALEMYKKQQAERNGAKPTSRLHNAFKEDFEDIAADKANMNKIQNSTGNSGNGSYQATMQGGKVKPGATFTPNGGQQGQRPLPGAGGQINTPPVPFGAQPMPTNKTIPSRRIILD